MTSSKILLIQTVHSVLNTIDVVLHLLKDKPM